MQLLNCSAGILELEQISSAMGPTADIGEVLRHGGDFSDQGRIVNRCAFANCSIYF